MRGVLGIAFTFVTVVLAAWIFLLPPTVRYLAQGALGRLGFQVSGGHVSIGLDRAEISDLALSGGNASLAATYSLGGLAHGQFLTLEVTDVSLHGKLAPDGSLAIEGFSRNASPAERSPAAVAIPAEQVLIHHLALTLDSPIGQVSLTGNGVVVPIDGGLRLSGDMGATLKELELHAPLKLELGAGGIDLDLAPIKSPQASGAVALHVKGPETDLRNKAGGSLQLRDFGFARPQLVVSGANGSIDFARLSPLATADRQHLTIKRLDLGQTLTDLSIDFALADGHLLSIGDASGGVMGGELRIRNQTIDLRSQEQSVTLELKAVDLSQLLALANLDGLSATGKLDGSVPIRHKNDTIEIDNAAMNATEPGVLRYDPADPPSFLKDAQSAEILLLRDALKDFHYQKLALTISGRLGAEEEIKMALTGNNPSLYGGKTIELNLDFTGSLDKIARWSLQSFASPLEAVRKLKPSSGDRE